jgi:hypothetical protein
MTSALRRFIERAINDRTELAQNGGGQYDREADELLREVLDELTGTFEDANAVLDSADRRAYARGWNDCCDTFRVGCHIVPEGEA